MKFEEVREAFKAYRYQPTTLPVRSTSKSAGYDFFLKEDVTILPGEHAFQYTDVKRELARDEVLLLFIRSTVGINKHLTLANGTGVIDADYYNNSNNNGNIGLTLFNYGKEVQTMKKGERIMQGIVVDYKVSENDISTSVRSGGFGSTGV